MADSYVFTAAPTVVDPPPLAFSWLEAVAAAETWGANCGPGALAACLELPIDAVRTAIPGFEVKHYTSPLMMRAALATFGAVVRQDLRGQERETYMFPALGLVRIQWEGPWTAPGSNPRWAYRHTHWVASRFWGAGSNARMWIFDINGGWLPGPLWEASVVPLLLANVKRGTGWHATHRWSIERPAA